MPYYEVLCLANARITRPALTDFIRGTILTILNQNGLVTRVEPLGTSGPRQLAYRIRRNQINHDSAYFINICAITSPDTLKEINRRLSLDNRVIRHLSRRMSLEAMERRIPDPDYRFKESEIDVMRPEFESERFSRLHYGLEGGRDVRERYRKRKEGSMNIDIREKTNEGLKYLIGDRKGGGESGDRPPR